MADVVYCTIASANYLPQITTLEESLRRSHPGARFEVLLCERPEVVAAVSAEVGRRFHGPHEIGCADWRRMAFHYDLMEFNTAVKPYFLRKLLEEHAAVVYFDPDIVVYDSLAELEGLVLSHDAVLTPHVCEPLGDDGRDPTVLDLNRVGQFNLGFAAFRAGPRTERALRWWEDRCRFDCVVDVENGVFVDQSWANMLVSFLEAKVLRSERYNMAYWNVHQRTLRLEDGRFVTADGPLVFFHFSSLDLARLGNVSRHQNRVTAAPGTPLREILEQYVRTLAGSPYASCSARPYSFGAFDDGAPIEPGDRQRYRSLSTLDRDAGPDPFAARPWIRSIHEIWPSTPAGGRELPLGGRLPERPPVVPSRLYLKLNGAVKRAFPQLHHAAKKALSQQVRKRIKKLFA